MNIVPPDSLTVVIPTRNSEASISFCLQSILASFERAQCTFEVIVVLDRCQDSTEEQARKFPVRIVQCQGKGRSAARNTGAAVSSSSYLCFIDSDTVVDLSFFSNLLKRIDDGGHDWIQACVLPVTQNQQDWFFRYFASSYYRLSNGTYNVLEGWKHPELPKGDSAALVVRRQAFEKVGYFDASLVRYEDHDLARRFFLNGFRLSSALDLQSKKLVEPKNIFQFYRYRLEGLHGLARSRGHIPARSQLGIFSRNHQAIRTWFRGTVRFFYRELAGGQYKLALFCMGLPVIALFESALLWFRSSGSYEKGVRRALRRLGLQVDPFHPHSFGSISNSKGQFRFSPFQRED